MEVFNGAKLCWGIKIAFYLYIYIGTFRYNILFYFIKGMV